MSAPLDVVVFAGGGTGGHLIPGLAVAEYLRQEGWVERTVFIGSQRFLEKRLLTEAGVEHIALPVQSLAQAKRFPLFLGRNLWAVFLAVRHLQHLRPRVVVGLGGFASFPVSIAACSLRIPLVLLEQNVVPGRVTRWLSRAARAVCVPCEETASRLPRGARVRITGNPVRFDVLEAARRRERLGEPTAPTLLVVGGSQGAAALNAAAPLAVEQLLQTGTAGDAKGGRAQIRIVHQSGPHAENQVRRDYERLGVPATVSGFFENLPSWLAKATVVVSRAGGTTLAEIACVGVPAVLVPYPFAADDHQQANAQRLAQAGAARIVHQPPDTLNNEQTKRRFASRLAEAVAAFLNDNELRHQASQALRRLAQPDAAAQVARVIQEAVTTGKAIAVAAD